MTHEEFMLMYDKSLQHGWVTSRDSNKAAQQKQREKEYNAKYYQTHKDKWNVSKSIEDAEVAAADALDKAAGKGEFARKLHGFQIRARNFQDKVVDETINSLAKNAGASDLDIAASQAKRVADRATRRAIDAGQRKVDRLQGESEAQVILNDLSRKAKRAIEKAKPVVKKILATAEAVVGVYAGKSNDEINATYRKRTGENKDIVSGGKTTVTTKSITTRRR